MAYLKISEVRCEYPGCVSKATRHLINEDFTPIGFFCKRHGETRLAEVDREEREKRQAPKLVESK